MKEEGLEEEEEEGEGFFPPHFIICSCCFGVWNSLDLVVKLYQSSEKIKSRSEVHSESFESSSSQWDGYAVKQEPGFLTRFFSAMFSKEIPAPIPVTTFATFHAFWFVHKKRFVPWGGPLCQAHTYSVIEAVNQKLGCLQVIMNRVHCHCMSFYLKDT